MRDPNAGKYKKLFKDEFQLAQKFLADKGGALEWSDHDYEAFRYTGGGVCLIFYPHKTSAGHRHIRVRDGGSKKRGRAAEMIVALGRLTNDCTFTCNGISMLWDDKEQVRGILKGRKS